MPKQGNVQQSMEIVTDMHLIRSIKKTVDKLDRSLPSPRRYRLIMSKNEIELFDNLIQKSQHYLEFGMGGSTIRALIKSKAKVYTVESSHDWIEAMREYRIIRNQEKHRLRVFRVDIGPTREWGHPQSEDHHHLFEGYSSGVFKSINAGELDFILIDGRFRVACVLKTILACHGNERVRIMIHDFWNREEYHRVLEHLDVLDKVDTAGIFSIKKNVDLAAVEADYRIYKTVPD